MAFPHFDFTVNVPTIIAVGGFLITLGKKLATKVTGLIDKIDSVSTTQSSLAALEQRVKYLEEMAGKK